MCSEKRLVGLCVYVHVSMRVSLQKWSLFRNSLAVQWLALSTFTAEGLVQSLIRELRSHKPRGVGKGKEKSGPSLYKF